MIRHGLKAEGVGPSTPSPRTGWIPRSPNKFRHKATIILEEGGKHVMGDLKSKIIFSGVNPPHSTSKIIERQVQKWIEREQSLLFLPKRASYTVYIDREDYPFYTCHIGIQIGSREWSGIEEGRSIYEAVLNTLKYMKPKERIDNHRPSPLPSPVQVTA